MSRKRIQSRRAARKRRQRRIALGLALGGTALVVGAVALIVSGSTGRAAAEYDPQDVVYDAPLHGVHEMGPATVPVNFLPQDGPQPRIVVPQTFQSLGRVPASSDPQHTFVLRNEGEAPLTISRIYTTCGCTVADLTASVIPPGKVALLTVTLDADFHPEAIGTSVRRGVIIESNDPRQSVSETWIEAYIAPS